MITILRSKSAKVVLLAILLAYASPAFGRQGGVHAQSEAISLNAAVGFDGYCRDERWLPVRVQIENSGADLDASVQISYKNGNGGITSTTTDVQLPTSSRKVFFVYIFADGSLRDFAVSVLEGDKVLQKVKLSANCFTGNILLVGVVSDTPAAFDGLSDITPLKGTVRVAQLRITDLPERSQAWESLDALVISNVDTDALTAPQLQALESWLGLGGKLLVTGGSQWQRTTAGLNEFLPVEIRSTRNVTRLSSLSTYFKDQSLLEAGTIISVGTMRERAQALVEQDGIPILAQRTVGAGAVYYLAADPSASPLLRWAGMKTLYEQALTTRPPLAPWTDTSFDSSNGYGYTEVQALGAIKELSMPSILYICGLLGLYVIVMGPLHFLVLRRAKRRELAWMTIPTLVILFSCVFYGTGFAYRGITPILNRLLVVQAWDGAKHANVKALVGVYSPIRSQYDITAGEQFMPRAFQGGFGDLQAGNAWTILQQDASMIIPETRVEIGGMKALVLEGSLPVLPISHDLAIDLGDPNSYVKGAVENQSEFMLQDAMIVAPGGWVKLGDLASGDSADVNLKLAANSQGPIFYSLDPMQILGLDYNDIETNVDAARQYSFLQAVVSNNEYPYTNTGNWGIYLMGWMDHSDLPVDIAGRQYDTVDTMLYIHNLAPDIKTDGDTLYLPAGFFAWESSEPTVSPYTMYEVPTGEYTLRFTPAVPVRFRSVQSLKLTLNSSNPSALTAYAWDFENEDWVQLPRNSILITVPEPERFVASNGEVRIRVVLDQSTYTEITSTSITMVVEP